MLANILNDLRDNIGVVLFWSIGFPLFLWLIDPARKGKGQ